MAKSFTTGLVITGDAAGGVRAIRMTQSELQRLGGGFQRTGQQSRQFSRNVNSTSNELNSLTSTLRPLAGLMAGVFAVSILKSQIDFADSLHKMNLRLGVSTEALSEYNYVAGLSGVEFGTLSTAWQRQTRRIAEAAQGTGVAVKALDTLGLSAKELNQLKPEEQFERIAAALESIESPGQKASLAMKLWDTEGVKLLQITNQGAAAMADMRQEAVDLGQSISNEAATSMADFNDSLARVQALASGTTDTLLAELIPGITQTVNGFTDFVKGSGGAAVVADKLTTGAGVLATIYAGRLVGSIGAKTAATVKGVAAEHAARLETAQRTAQDKIAEAQTTRRTVAEKTAAANTARLAAQRTQLAQTEAAEKLRSIQQTQQQMAVERLLEAQRLQAKITATERQQSLTRLAEIRRVEVGLITQVTAAEQRLTQATVANDSATRIQNITKLELARSTKIADAAMISSIVSTNAATSAQVAMAGATKALSSGMALLGGPLGVAFLAGSALYYFAQRSKEAGVDANQLRQEVDALTGSFRNMSDIERRVKLEKLNYELAKTSGEIAKSTKLIEDWKVGMSRMDGSSNPMLPTLIDRENNKLQVLNAELVKTKTRMDLVFSEGIPDQWIDGNKPKQEAPSLGIGGGKSGKADNTANLHSTAQKYLQELERLNATEQQQIEYWRKDSVAQTASYYQQGLIAAEQFEFGKASIADEAARRLQAIEDKRWSKYTSGGLGELAKLQRDSQGMSGPQGALIQGGVAQDIAKQSFQGLPTMSTLSSEFDTGFGEANKLEKEKEEMLAAYDQRIADYQNYRELELENAELYDEQLAALRAKRDEQELAADSAIMQAKLAGAESTFGSLASIAGTFAGKQSGIYKAMFATEKAFSIARSVIAIQAGIAQASAIPFPANIGAMASVAAATAGIVSTISSVVMPVGQAHDGHSLIPKSGTWNLEAGERVTGAALNQDLTKFLERENKASAGLGGQKGGVTINQTFNVEVGAGGEMSSEALQNLYRTMKRAAHEVIMNEKRPGGALSG